MGIALFVCAAAIIFWSNVLFYKYDHFGYYDWDLAFFAQACRNLLHGSQYVSLVGINYFGDHSYFITFLYLPFYALIQHPMTLVALKVLAYAASAFILFRMVYFRHGLSIALALLIGYLCFPANAFTLIYDFNPESLVMPFLLLMFDTFERKRWGWFWLNTVLVLMVKENFTLVAAAFAIYGLITGRRDPAKQVHASILLVLSAALFFFFTQWLIPHFRQLSTHAFVVRYAHLGNSVGEIITNFFTRPEIVWNMLMHPSNAVFINDLFGPWLVPSLIGLPILCVSLPILLQHLLSASAQEHTIYYHYGMTFAPFIFLAVSYGIGWLKQRMRLSILSIMAWLLVFIACMGMTRHSDQFWSRLDYHPDHLSAERWDLVRSIPKDAGVIASFDFLAALSNRADLYSFHKVYDDFYQAPAKIAQSELNVKSRFVVPPQVRYALIDYRDGWMASTMRHSSEVTEQRINEFLKDWKPLKSYGSMVLYTKRYE